MLRSRAQRVFALFLQGAVLVSLASAGAEGATERRPVVAIRVLGNRSTKPWVIIRELKTQVGDIPDSARLAEDRDRVLNLQLFERVEISLEEGPNGDTLTVRVWERWHFFPYPILFINERDFRKLSYGAGIVHLNVAGRAQVLSGSGWAGYDPCLQLEYYNPWFGGPRRLFCEAVLSFGSVRSKSHEALPYTERRGRLEFSLGKRFGYSTYLAAVGMYTDHGTKPWVPGVIVSPAGRDRFGTVMAHFRMDFRDLRAYPWRGWYLKLNLEQNGIGSRWVNYQRFLLDSRVYAGDTRNSLAARLLTVLSFGTVPNYDRVYFGYEERVRGHFYDHREGSRQVVLSVEWRRILFPLRYWESPLPRNLVPTLKFGLNLAVFADAGAVWSRGSWPERSRWLRGYGIGFHLRIPYVEALRFELALDEHGRAQAIADLGAFF